MREGWREVRLGDVVSQYIEPIKVEPERYYTNIGVQWYAGGTFQREQKRGADMKATRLFRVRPGQFIYNRMFVTEGSFALVAEDHANGVVSNEFPVFDVNDAIILPEYLLLNFKQAAAWARIADEATGTTKSRRRWKESQLVEYRIPLPSLAEQRRIVDLIAAVDDAIVAADGEAVAAETLSRSVRRHLLRPQPSWEAVTLGDVSRVVTGRSFKAEHQGHSTGLVPYFRVSDMTAAGNERELLMPNDWLDEEGVAAVKPVVCPPGTVVFPILGAALATEKRRVLGIHAGFVQHMIGLVPGPRVLSGILLAVMQDVRLADFSQHGAMPSVNQKLVSAIAFALPPLDAQERIVEQLRAVENAADAARGTADALRTLRSNLLTVLLSGEHEIPESYDRFLILDEEAAA